MTFKQVQQNFIDYVLNNTEQLPVNTDVRHMDVYRELVFNNIEDVLTNAFPVLNSLYEKPQWEQLLQHFFSTHTCQTAIYAELPDEFMQFLQTQYQLTEYDPIFMLELAHYEWLELSASMAIEDVNSEKISKDQAIETNTFLLSHTANIAQYHFDVQNICQEYQPKTSLPQPEFFCIYRNDNDEVLFLRLAPLTAQLLNYIENYPHCTWLEISLWLIETYGDMEIENLEQHGQQMFLTMVERGIIRRCLSNN